MPAIETAGAFNAETTPPGRCPYQKLRPTVLVVEATEDAHWNDPPDPVDRSMDWGVFARPTSPKRWEKYRTCFRRERRGRILTASTPRKPKFGAIGKTFSRFARPRPARRKRCLWR